MPITRDRLGRFASAGGGKAGAKKIMKQRDEAAKQIKGLRAERLRLKELSKQSGNSYDNHSATIKKRIKNVLFNAKAASGELHKGRFFG